MYPDVIPAHLVRIMAGYQRAGIRRILTRLQENGVLRNNCSVPMKAVPSRLRGCMMKEIARATAEFEREQARSQGDDTWKYLRNRLYVYRKNAVKKRLRFDLTVESLRAIYERADGRCEVTGIKFDLATFGSTRAPFSPSIDRMDGTFGYTISNVRLTCQMVNLAMNVWGDVAMMELLKRVKDLSEDA